MTDSDFPDYPPAPTAPQDGEQRLSSERKEVRELTDAQLVSASDLLPMVLRAMGQTTGSVVVEEFRSRLSSLSTELVRVRGENERLTRIVELVNAEGSQVRPSQINPGYVVVIDGRTGADACCRSAVECFDWLFEEADEAALGGLVPPDASPRRTE